MHWFAVYINCIVLHVWPIYNDYHVKKQLLLLMIVLSITVFCVETLPC